MPSIGSSPGVGSGVQVDVSKVRAQTTSDSLTASTQLAGSAATGAQAGVQGTAVSTSAISAGQQAPVDMDRVSTIRKAIQSGSYPVVPTKIGDAMIAAGLLLRGAK